MIDKSNREMVVITVFGMVGFAVLAFLVAGWAGLGIFVVALILGAGAVAILTEPFLDHYDELLREKLGR